MVELNFEMVDAQPERSFEPLEPGWYPVVINHTSEEISKAGNKYLLVEFECTGPDVSGRRIWHNFNLWNPDPKALKIAQRTCTQMAHAVGKTTTPFDSDELLGLHLDIQLIIKKGNEMYPPKNEAVAWRTAPNGPAVAAAQQAAQASQPAAILANALDDPPW